MANWFLECDDGKFYISDYAESCVGNANAVIRKERKTNASFALGGNPECCHFYHGKMEPYIKVQSPGLGIWKAENIDENSRKGCEVGNWSAYLDLRPLEDGNTQFPLFTTNCVIHLRQLSSSNWQMLSSEKFSQINLFQSWTCVTERETQVISRIKMS